jgi:hypothetical protein
MTDTITRLIQAIAARDQHQFPQLPPGVASHEAYAKEYVLDMLRELLCNDPDLDQYFEQRVELVEADIETAAAWGPK